MEGKWGGDVPLFERGLEEWKVFRDVHFPKEKDVNDYIKANPTKYHVPFLHLFASPDSCTDSSNGSKNENKEVSLDILLKGETQPSIRQASDGIEIASRKVNDEGLLFQDTKEPKKEASKWEDLTIAELKRFGFVGCPNPSAKVKKDELVAMIKERKPSPSFPKEDVKLFRNQQSQPSNVKSEIISWDDSRITRLVMAQLLGQPKLVSRSKQDLLTKVKQHFKDIFPAQEINNYVDEAAKSRKNAVVMAGEAKVAIV